MGQMQSQVELAQLRALSLIDLRTKLNGNSKTANNVDHVSAATAMMLCLCEMIAGGTEPDSRMLHLQGAAAILRLSMKTSFEQKRFDDLATEVMLWKMWKELELLAFQCGKPSMSRATKFLTRKAPREIDQYIDIFDGFSSSLLPLLNRFEALQTNPSCTAQLESTPPNLAQEYYEYQKINENIMENAQRMISTWTYAFHPGVAMVLSETERADLEALNETYHYVVVLQAQTNASRLPATVSHIQQSVTAITKCLSKINLQRQSCSGLAVLHAIFAAGCEASEETSRGTIAKLLNGMERFYGMNNARFAREFLKELWTARDTRTEGPYLQWDIFLSKSLLPLLLFGRTKIQVGETDWDLALY